MASDVVVGDVKLEEEPEVGYLRWNLAGEVIAGEVEELQAGAVAESGDGAVQAVVMEVEEAKVGEGRERIDRASEVERREGEAHHSAVWGALHAAPWRGGAGVAAGPVSEEVAV